MKLLLDLGNTCLKWGIAQAGEFHVQAAVDYRDTVIERELQAVWENLPSPEKLLLASVGKISVKASVLSLAAELWPDCEIMQPVASAAAFGVTNAYQQPEKLGIDRWLALLAAHNHYPGSHKCIVDCGTAVTLDMLAADGVHLGGLICPGLQTMKTALAANTAALQIQAGTTLFGLGDNTAAAIDNGTRFAIVGMIESLLNRQTEPYQLIVCGGDGPSIAGLLQRSYILDRELVFKGLGLYG